MHDVRARRWRPPSRWLAPHLAAVRYSAGVALSSLGAWAVLLLVAAVAVLVPVGVGLLGVGAASQVVRRWCDLDRARTGRFLGHRISSPYPAPTSWGPSAARRHAADGVLARDLGAVIARALLGLPLGAVAVVLPLAALSSALIPLYWWSLPADEPTGSLFTVTSWWGAIGSALVGGAGLALWAATATLARWDAALAARLLAPGRERELRLRAEVEAGRRRSAISAHTAELRRIERDLHDAAQNRMVAVAMFVGMAQRQVETGAGDPAATLERARQATEEALAEMRRVIQGIYPPVLTEDGLVPALGQLVDQLPVPTRLHVEDAAPTPAAVDAALYFSIAEALTNVAKHSEAGAAEVVLRWEERDGAPWVVATVTDDGRGAADPAAGSGLAGIADRVEALGGRLDVTSPAGGPTAVRLEVPCAS